MGVHAAFFGPIKYSVLPDHLKKNELLAANGLIEAGTFLSILLGTIIGGLYNFNGGLVVVFAKQNIFALDAFDWRDDWP